jgi:DNA-binding CsgD family transcriptional regulator
LAVAELAHSELWQGEPSGPARVQDAIRLARACGSAKALAYALTAKVTARVLTGDSGGLSEAQEAQGAAANATDFFTFVDSALWVSDCLGGAASWDAVERLRLSRQEMSALGAPHCYIAWLSAMEAQRLLLLGDGRSCAERLRVALGSNPGRLGDTTARLTAAQLACRQGRLADAEAHLARAEELFTNQWAYLALTFEVVRAELAVATGDTERAIMLAKSGLEWEGPRLNQVERLMPLAARAAADHAQARRDRGADPTEAVAQLLDLRSRYPTVVVNPVRGPMYQQQLRAMQAWYDAEVLRGQDDPAASGAWQRAAQACADAELAWDEAYAWWRAAEALAKDPTARTPAAAALRRAHEIAVDLQAAPLLADVEALAQSARVSLAAIDESPPPETEALPGLTPREREILAHIVAGRTYGEIARELVLSEKTVSVHVSHLLRKTGTANRVELAQLARRVASSRPG